VLMSRFLEPGRRAGRKREARWRLSSHPSVGRLATVISRKLPLPQSKVMSSGAQMLAGGIFLSLSQAARTRGISEFSPVGPFSLGAWLALLYFDCGGLHHIGFTAYVWLIHHESPTKVGNVRLRESGRSGAGWIICWAAKRSACERFWETVFILIRRSG